MEELREEVSVKDSLRRKLMRSRLKCFEHVERIEGDRLTERADTLRSKEKRKT